MKTAILFFLSSVWFSFAAEQGRECVAEDRRVSDSWCRLNCFVTGTNQLHPACDPLVMVFPLCRCSPNVPLNCAALDRRVTSDWCQANCYAAGEGLIHPACMNSTEAAPLCSCAAPGNCTLGELTFINGAKQCRAGGGESQVCHDGSWSPGGPCPLVGQGEVCVGRSNNNTVITNDMLCEDGINYVCHGVSLDPIGNCSANQVVNCTYLAQNASAQAVSSGGPRCASGYSSQLNQTLLYCGLPNNVNSSYSLCYFGSEYECGTGEYEKEWILSGPAANNASYHGFACPTQ